MKLISHIKYLFVVIIILITNSAFASGERPTDLLNSKALIKVGIDSIPRKQQQQQPDNSKKNNPGPPAKPEVAKPIVKEVPRARPMPKPKVVVPKVRPVKVIKPKIGPKL